jgi:hypothetical protein
MFQSNIRVRGEAEQDYLELHSKVRQFLRRIQELAADLDQQIRMKWSNALSC